MLRLDDDDCNYAYFDGLQQRCEALYSRCAGAEEDMANYAEAVDRYIASAEYFVRDHPRRKAIRDRLNKVRKELNLQIRLSSEL